MQKETYIANIMQADKTATSGCIFKMLSKPQKTSESFLGLFDKNIRKRYRLRRSLRSAKFTAKNYEAVK